MIVVGTCFSIVISATDTEATNISNFQDQVASCWSDLVKFQGTISSNSLNLLWPVNIIHKKEFSAMSITMLIWPLLLHTMTVEFLSIVDDNISCFYISGHCLFQASNSTISLTFSMSSTKVWMCERNHGGTDKLERSKRLVLSCTIVTKLIDALDI